MLAPTDLFARAKVVFDRRFEGHPAWTILVELFIGLGWLRAAVEKIVSRDWWSGEAIERFVASNRSLTIRWYEPFLDEVIMPNVSTVNVLIVVAQLTVAGSLLAGYRMNYGLFVGMTMNINFIMIGAVDPSIFYLILQASIAFWLFEHRPVTSLTLAYLKWIVVLSVVLFLVSAPFVETIDPALVIEDPAMILATYGISIGFAGYMALSRLRPKLADLVVAEQPNPAGTGRP